MRKGARRDEAGEIGGGGEWLKTLNVMPRNSLKTVGAVRDFKQGALNAALGPFM